MLISFLLAAGTIGGTSGISYYIFRRLFKSKEDSLREDYNQQLEQVQKDSKVKAAKSLKRSKEVRIGMGEENLVAYHEDFPYDAGDVRPLGSPIDGLIFAGNVQGDIEEIVFLEVKTGNSRLSKTQKQIKDLVEHGNVKWLEFRVKTKKVKLEHMEELAEIDDCLCGECVDN